MGGRKGTGCPIFSLSQPRNPNHKSLIEKLENVHKRATKLVINVKKLHYEERLRRLKIPTLKYRS